jgi:Uma2 family endonuclease
MTTKPEATVDDLYHVPEHGKAEIVNGELVLMPPTGGVPGRAAGEISICLRGYEKRVGGGYAFPDNVGFIVNLPQRRSFSPDTAFFKGGLRGGLFLEGGPVFAVEVRSSDDYGPADERRMAQKRADYCRRHFGSVGC